MLVTSSLLSISRESLQQNVWDMAIRNKRNFCLLTLNNFRSDVIQTWKHANKNTDKCSKTLIWKIMGKWHLQRHYVLLATSVKLRWLKPNVPGDVERDFVRRKSGLSTIWYKKALRSTAIRFRRGNDSLLQSWRWKVCHGVWFHSAEQGRVICKNCLLTGAYGLKETGIFGNSSIAFEQNAADFFTKR